MRMSNKSRVPATIIFALFFLSVFSFASETRINTLGSVGIFLKDDANVMLFPGTLFQYTNLVVAEMRTKTNPAKEDYSIGIHMDYGNMVSGLYINQPIRSVILRTGLDEFEGLGISRLNNSYVLMMGVKADGLDVGFGVITAGSNSESGSGDFKRDESSSYIGILGGVSNKKMDLGIMLEIPSITLKVGAGKAEYSGFSLNANGRYFLMKRNGASIFPVGRVTFGSSSFEVKAGRTTDYSLLRVALGVGMEKRINEDNSLVVGLEAFSMLSVAEDTKGGVESTATIYTLPGFYVGIESRIASWLIGRVGAAHVNQKLVEEDKPDGGTKTETISNSSAFKLSLGLGIEFGSFLIDFAMNEKLLFDGPYIFGRADNGTQFAGQVSITYDFGGENE